MCTQCHILSVGRHRSWPSPPPRLHFILNFDLHTTRHSCYHCASYDRTSTTDACSSRPLALNRCGNADVLSDDAVTALRWVPASRLRQRHDGPPMRTWVEHNTCKHTEAAVVAVATEATAAAAASGGRGIRAASESNELSHDQNKTIISQLARMFQTGACVDYVCV